MAVPLAPLTGNLSTFGLDFASLLAPELVLNPSGPATVGPDYILASNPVIIALDTEGSFAQNVVVTSGMRPVCWYEPTIRSLDSAGGYIYADFPGWRLFMPPEGGTISDLLEMPWNPTLAWAGPDEPPGTPVANTLWLDTDSPMSTLSIWSN